jgi:hypothetical protein
MSSMNAGEETRVESGDSSGFAKALEEGRVPFTRQPEETQRARINLDENKVKNGLGQLVLTLVKLLHELLERQAIRRMDSGSLTDAEVERIGLTLMQQAQTIERLRKEFGLEEEDLNLDLGPLGKLL